MKAMNNTKLSLIFATVGLVISCINLVTSEFQGTSIVLFCSLIAIWICSLEEYKKSNKDKTE